MQKRPDADTDATIDEARAALRSISRLAQRDSLDMVRERVRELALIVSDRLANELWQPLPYDRPLLAEWTERATTELYAPRWCLIFCGDICRIRDMSPLFI